MGQEDFRKAERIIRKLDKIRNIKDIRNELPWHPTRRWKTRDPESIKRIVVHTTGSSNQDPFKTNNYHIHPNHISKNGCFAQGVRVLTNKGYKNIEDITIGDYVISPTSLKERRVTHTYKYYTKEEVFEIKWKLDNGFKEKVLATSEHPFLIWKAPKCDAPQKLLRCRGPNCLTKKYHKKNLKREYICSGEKITEKDIEASIKWLQISEIEDSDFSAIYLGKENKELPHSPLMAYLAGWYLAEGWQGNHGSICLGLNATTEFQVMEELSEIAKTFGYCSHFRIREKTNTIELTICGNIYNKVIKDFVVGKYSWEKKLTKTFMECKKNYQSHLFSGYMKGDGYNVKNRQRGLQVSTASEELWHQLFILGARLGYMPSKILGRKPRNHVIQGRNIKTKQEYIISLTKGTNFCTGILTNNYLLIPFSSITKVKYEGYVYNLTVEKDEDYYISSIPTHNCPRLCYANFINQDGLIYLCNDYTDITWHCGLWNSSSIGLVMAFKGQTNTEKPTDKQYLSMIYQCSKLCTEFNIHPHNVIGHREVPGMYTILGNGSKKYKKSCPGMAISLPFLRKNVIITLQSQMTLNGLYTAEIDGLWGKLSTKGFKQLVSDCKKEQCDDSK